MDPIKVIKTAAEPGHFYSPVVDPDDLVGQQARLWPECPNILGIDFNDAEHEYLLREVFPAYMPGYDYPEHVDESDDLTEFFTQNSQFSWLDSRSLFVLLRAWKPKRIIEIGSGFSTLLTADVARRFLDGDIEITCIEPYPREFLRKGIPGVNRLIEEKVQNVTLSTFEELNAGDILFVDSSHVAKTGSDVNHIYFEILPRLAKGVIIHIHDIFFPHEYPKEWVLTENRSWNEQYLVRALLMYSSTFKVKFGCSYAYWRFPELVKKALSLPSGHAFGGGSLWIERIG
jgi:predicted O-methyltransferase YrrM